MLGEWHRVSRKRPCPICTKSDRCGISSTGDAAICRRVESDKLTHNRGWLYRLNGATPVAPARRFSVPLVVNAPAADFGELAGEYAARATATMLTQLASDLRVSSGSLCRLHAGHDVESYTFPMRGADGTVVGIRRRFPDGRKLSVRGGREGLFVPEGLAGDGLLLVTEGPTDTAAPLTLGLAAIGRPSCQGELRLQTAFCRGRHVALLADSDRPGIQGAEIAAGGLALCCPSVRLMHPPDGIKDARVWVQRGGTRDEIENALRAAPGRSLGVKVKRW